MEIFSYITTYLLIGAVIMLILDLMHNAVRDQIPEDIPGYTNLERVYIVLVWPGFLYGLYKAANSEDDGEQF